jgi:hypothetical protein
VGSQPLVYLYLSQVPYTGLDLGPVGTALYWLALIAWSVAAAYLVLFLGVPYANRSVRLLGVRVSDALNASRSIRDNMISSVSVPPMPELPARHTEHQSVPTPEKKEVLSEITHSYSPYEGFKSFAHNGALSIEDIVKGLSRHGEQSSVPMAVPEPVVAAAVQVPEPEDSKHYEPVVHTAVSEALSDMHGFTSALVAGDRATVFSVLREHVRCGGAPESLISSAVCLLDDTYRARVEGSQCDAHIERVAARLDTPTLEKLVAALATAIDSSYSDSVTGAKLAFTRALAVLGA